MSRFDKKTDMVDIKMVERQLVRGLNEFWYEHVGFNQRSLCIGESYNDKIGLGVVGPGLVIHDLVGGQVYFSMLVSNDLQIEFEFVGREYVNAFESVVCLLLAIEVVVNFQYSVLVQGLVNFGNSIEEHDFC